VPRTWRGCSLVRKRAGRRYQLKRRNQSG
jgi:hypothetical protein